MCDSRYMRKHFCSLILHFRCALTWAWVSNKQQLHLSEFSSVLQLCLKLVSRMAMCSREHEFISVKHFDVLCANEHAMMQISNWRVSELPFPVSRAQLHTRSRFAVKLKNNKTQERITRHGRRCCAFHLVITFCASEMARTYRKQHLFWNLNFLTRKIRSVRRRMKSIRKTRNNI